jgi:hypothetical protein
MFGLVVSIFLHLFILYIIIFNDVFFLWVQAEKLIELLRQPRSTRTTSEITYEP